MPPPLPLVLLCFTGSSIGPSTPLVNPGIRLVFTRREFGETLLQFWVPRPCSSWCRNPARQQERGVSWEFETLTSRSYLRLTCAVVQKVLHRPRHHAIEAQTLCTSTYWDIVRANGSAFARAGAVFLFTVRSEKGPIFVET